MEDDRAPVRSRRTRWMEGLASILLALLVTELVSHGPFPAPEPTPAALLIASLAAVVHAAFRGGLGPGVAAATLVGLYTAHLLSPHRDVVAFTREPLQGAGIMLAIGLVMALSATGLKRREDRLHAELEVRAADLERTNRELRRTNETLEAFTHVIGHDLKEPVRAIENYLDAAEEEHGTPQAREFVRRAHESNRRMAALLQGLLAYGRASTPPQDLVDVDLARLLRDPSLRAPLDPMLKERGVTLDVATDLPRVRGTEAGLRQVLGSLLLNSLRHNPKENPRIAVRLGPVDAERVEIRIDDDGPGFPVEVLRRFERTHTDPSTIKGGFGLLIAQRAIHAMGGDVRLDRSPEGGARVRVVLRRA